MLEMHNWYFSIRNIMKLFYDKFSSAKYILYKNILWSHWVNYGMYMWGNHIAATLVSSFNNTSCGKHTWLTACSCCTLESITVFILRTLPQSAPSQWLNMKGLLGSGHSYQAWNSLSSSNFCLRNSLWTG